MYNEIITFVKCEAIVNDYGDSILKMSEREIYASVQSIGTKEFYQANAVGLKPEIKFLISDYLDYENEQIVKYQSFGGNMEEYKVIRTYRKGNELEITCKRGID